MNIILNIKKYYYTLKALIELFNICSRLQYNTYIYENKKYMAFLLHPYLFIKNMGKIQNIKGGLL